MSLSYDEIAEIIKLIDSSSCDELVVETGDMKLVVRRNGVSPAAAAEYTERGSPPIAVSREPAPEARTAAPKVEAAAGGTLFLDEIGELSTVRPPPKRRPSSRSAASLASASRFASSKS